MIYIALFNRAEDAFLLEKEFREQTALCTDESLAVRNLLEKKSLEEFLEGKEICDFVCVDVAFEKGICLAERIRNHYPMANIVLVADSTMSPVKYLKPSIMAAALLLKPLRQEVVVQTVKQLFSHFVVKVDEKRFFVIESRDEKQRIPFQDILYFEARAKKIYACTLSHEYGFYDTIENLNGLLPENFVRSHRSYIVNMSYVKKIMVSKGCMYLEADIEIPLSRSYKGVMKNNVKQ